MLAGVGPLDAVNRDGDRGDDEATLGMRGLRCAVAPRAGIRQLRTYNAPALTGSLGHLCFDLAGLD